MEWHFFIYWPVYYCHSWVWKWISSETNRCSDRQHQVSYVDAYLENRVVCSVACHEDSFVWHNAISINLVYKTSKNKAINLICSSYYLDYNMGRTLRGWALVIIWFLLEALLNIGTGRPLLTVLGGPNKVANSKVLCKLWGTENWSVENISL